MKLGQIRGAIERADHFEVDAGDGAPFKVAKAALSPHLVERVRSLYCGGKVKHYADGGEVLPSPAGSWDSVLGRPREVDDSSSVPPLLAAPPSPPAAEYSDPNLIFPPLLSRSQRREQKVGLTPNLAAEYQAQQQRAAEGGDDAPITMNEDELGTAPVPAPVPAPGGAPAGAAWRSAAPASPAAPPDAVAEARAAGVEAARKIAEAGDLAKRSLDERASAEAQARAAEMSAAEGLVRAQDEATRRAELEADRLRDVYARGENALRLQKEKLAAREKELLDPEAMRIETGRVFTRADPVGLMIGAMMVGAAEAGLRKGSGTEAALKVIGDAIDRDVLAQKTEKGAIQTARFRAYEAAVGDVNNAAQLLKADQQLAASAAARLEAQRTQGAQGRLMLTQLANQLSAQARKTAEEAVQLITGQALAQQKAAGDAEARSIGMRQAEFALAKGAADLENAKRDDARADESLALSRAQLGIALRKEQRDEAAAAAGPRVDFDVIGKMGYGLAPAQWAQIKDDKAASSYVQTVDDQGKPVYRRARNEKAAESIAGAQMAAELAKTQLAKIEKYIPGPGKSPPSRLFWGEEARKADAEVESATQALTTQLKEIERLGALTGADLSLVQPRIPSAQAWFTSDEAEQQQAADLRESIDAMVDAIMHSSVAAPPGGWKKKKKGGQ